MKNTSKFRL